MAGVPPGSALETAISLTNLTALTRTAPASEQQGCDPSVTVSSSGAGVALSRYVITAPVTVPAGAPAPLRLASPAREALRASATRASRPGTRLSRRPSSPGTAILLDPAGALYAAIGAGNLRPYVQGQDDRGGAALSN